MFSRRAFLRASLGTFQWRLALFRHQLEFLLFTMAKCPQGLFWGKAFLKQLSCI